MVRAAGQVWDQSNLVSGQDTNTDAGFILAEEAALRKYLSGIQVPKFAGNKQGPLESAVPVYFRWPTSERAITYPYITIDLLSVDPAYSRWQSYINEMSYPAIYYADADDRHGVASNYYPDLARDIPTTDPDLFGFHSGPFLPYDLLFQISVFSRNVHHDRFLMSQFFVDFFSQRNFWVGTEIDGVWHRCELMSFVSGDSMETMEATKRQFRKIYTVRMETEVPAEKLYELRKVRSVNVKFFDQEDFLIDEFTDTTP